MTQRILTLETKHFEKIANYNYVNFKWKANTAINVSKYVTKKVNAPTKKRSNL